MARLNKYLSEVGYCSRRQADKLCEEGRIMVNGQIAGMGMQVDDNDSIVIDGKELTFTKKTTKPVLLMCYKPRGIVCTTSKIDKNNIIDFLNYKTRIYPIGRLDKVSEGLLLLTNQGEVANAIMKARNYHEKEYVVTVDKPVTDKILNFLRNGVDLGDVVTRPCKVWKSGENTFHIVLTQGINRQIRRMCEKAELHVRRLKRIRIMNIPLGDLKVGECREVPKEKADELLELLGLE